jgi:hypothetical protein
VSAYVRPIHLGTVKLTAFKAMQGA